VSQFEPISSPNILDGAKGLKTPDLFATGGFKQTERGNLIPMTNIGLGDDEEEDE
jgi:hypothetical protein